MKVVGFIACTADFEEQTQVLNAASEILIAAFGEYGHHARSAIGVLALPHGAAVEIEMVVSIDAPEEWTDAE